MCWCAVKKLLNQTCFVISVAGSLHVTHNTGVTKLWRTINSTMHIWIWSTALIQSRRLILFGHIMRMDDNTDAKRILLASPPADWRRQLGRPRIMWLSTVQQDLKQHHLRSPKQQIWLRTALCGGWCRRMALRNLRVAARNDDDTFRHIVLLKYFVYLYWQMQYFSWFL